MGILKWACVFCFGFLSTVASAREKVIFAHGLGISAGVYEALDPLTQVFNSYGYDVFIARTPEVGTIEDRAQVLAQEIARLVPVGPYHLIGHSMGGLDARLAIWKYGLGDRVLSLTTLSTPHHGSYVADFLSQKATGLKSGSFDGAMVAKLVGFFSKYPEAVEDLTSAHLLSSFNVQVLDDPRVRYFSMGFCIPRPLELHSLIPWLWAGNEILSENGESCNDGLVSTESAQWGQWLGSYLGDHYSETGPFPFIGGTSYRENFGLALSNLRKVFSK